MADFERGLETAAAPSSAQVPRKILIVEDNESVSRGMYDGLSDAGYDVACALDAESGVRLAEEFLPDVVVIDIGLPDRDGYEVARELRQSPAVCRAVLVAASGYGLRAFRQVSDHFVFDHYLLKPVSIEALSALIEHYTKSRASGGT